MGAEKRSENASKYVGVYFNQPAKKWMAYISIKGKVKYIGVYKTELEAFEAREKVKLSMEDKNQDSRISEFAICIFSRVMTYDSLCHIDDVIETAKRSVIAAKELIKSIDNANSTRTRPNR